MTPSSKTLKSRCTPAAVRVLGVGGVSPLEQMSAELMPMEQADTGHGGPEHGGPEHGGPESGGSKRPDPQQSGSEDPRAGPKNPLAPIGTARLRALREAIRNGTYPTEAHIVGGLERLFEDGPQ